MGKSILVAYASRAGSTGEIAESIAKELCSAGYPADVRRVQDVRAVHSYHAVVLGTAIRQARWLPEAMEFLEQHSIVLRQMPTAFFVACSRLFEKTSNNLETAAGWALPASQIVQPVRIGLFGGKMDYSKLPLAEHLVVRYAVKVPEKDARDWQEIRSWSRELIPLYSSG